MIQLMSNKMVLKVIFCIVLFTQTGCYFSPPYSREIIREFEDKIVLKLPEKKWFLLFETIGYRCIQPFEYVRGSDVFANVSGIVETDWSFTFKIGKSNDRISDIHALVRRVKVMHYNILTDNDFKKQQSSFIQGFKGEIFLAEYISKEAYGVEINQKNKILIMFYDGARMEIKLSKVHYKPEDEEAFKKLINSIKIIED